MASSVIPGVLDPTKPREYPIVLSDALLGKTSHETFTGVKYNHKPRLSSTTAPNSAKIKPASDGSYDLSFQDKGGKYAYNGNRSTGDGQFVLVFDPKRKVLVLHRVDSTFNMNLVQTPTNSDAESLRKQHPHLKSGSSQPDRKKAEPKPKPKTSSALKNTTRDTKKKPPKEKAPVNLTLPPVPAAQPEPPKPEKKKKKQVESEDEDESDGDGGLEVVWGDPPPSHYHRANDAPAFPPPMRRFSEFYNERRQEEEQREEEEDNDAGDEYDLLAAMEEDDDDDNQQTQARSPSPARHAAEEDTTMGNTGYTEPDFEDLEAELEAELRAAESESEVSEED